MTFCQLESEYTLLAKKEKVIRKLNHNRLYGNNIFCGRYIDRDCSKKSFVNTEYSQLRVIAIADEYLVTLKM